MSSKTVAILIIALLMLIAAPAIAYGETPPVRAPPLKTGLIMSDEVWENDVYIINATIANDVIVKVSPGVRIFMHEGTRFYVDGSLVIAGTQEDPVIIRAPGENGWDYIRVNSTGHVDFQNVTIMDTADYTTPLQFYGPPSVLKNVDLEGGWQGLWFQNKGGDLLKNIKVHDAEQYCIVLRNSAYRTDFYNLSTWNSFMGGLAIESSQGCNIYGFNGYNHSQGLVTTYDASLRIKDFSYDNPSFNEYNRGFVISGTSEVEITDGLLQKCNIGVYIYSVGSKVNMTNVGFVGINNSVVFNPTASGDLRFVDCDLSAFGMTVDMNGQSHPQRVEFINTTFTETSPIEVENDAILNISWFVDVKITDGMGDPLDARISYRESGPGPFTHLDSETGRFDKLVFRERTIEGGFPPDLVEWDLQFRPNEYPVDMVSMNDLYINGYTLWEIVFDLPPTNDLPSTIEVLEDEWYEIDLYDHFIDPEGQEMRFEIEESPDLNVVQTGGPTSGDVRIRNREADWFGAGWVIITATDTGGNTTSANVTIEVLPVNDAPRFIEPIPMKTIDEDSWTFFNLSGNVEDVEGDEVQIIFPEGQDCTIEYSNMNLTVWPEPDFFGMLGVEVNLSDGNAWSMENLIVNVTPVNDPPSVVVRLKDGSTVKLIEWDTPPLMVFDVDLEEDVPVDFWLDASDVDSANLTYSLVEEDLTHGTITVEAYEIENGTGVVPMNFTYIPAPNDNTGDDLVRFVVGDGENSTTVWVWFNVTPVDDPIKFVPPSEWNVTVDLDEPSTIDLAQWITEVDGETPVITTSSEYMSVNGTILTLLYDDTFIGTSQTVTVTVSDGTSQVTATLLVKINPVLGIPEIVGGKDEWVVTIEGSAGQDLWVVMEDKNGERSSYPMTYEDGKYTATIPKVGANKGDDFWISGSYNGDPIGGSQTGVIPSLKDADDDDDPFCLCCGALIVFVLILIVLLVVILLVTRSRGSKKEDEE